LNENNDKVVRVNILGQTYSIRSDDEEQVRRIAAYLNERFNRLKESSPALNRMDMAVMVAFKTADDLMAAQDQLDRLGRRVESQVDDLAARIEDGLRKSGAQDG
jgi:cell division protein ZapA (FtsZ GTPase activity inhibitor)